MSAEEVKRSFKSVLKRRLTSPLYGSFVLAWTIWNWKIIYLTIFVSQDLIRPTTKIDFILENYVNWYNLLVFPFLSAVVLITLIPFLANQAYRISLEFEIMRQRIKDKADNKKGFTGSELAHFQKQLINKEEQHNGFIDSAYKQIKGLEQKIKSLEEEKLKLANQLDAIRQKEIIEEDENKQQTEEMVQFAWREVTSGRSQSDIAIRLIEKFHINSTTANDLAETTIMKYGPDIYGKY